MIEVINTRFFLLVIYIKYYKFSKINYLKVATLVFNGWSDASELTDFSVQAEPVPGPGSASARHRASAPVAPFGPVWADL